MPERCELQIGTRTIGVEFENFVESRMAIVDAMGSEGCTDRYTLRGLSPDLDSSQVLEAVYATHPGVIMIQYKNVTTGILRMDWAQTPVKYSEPHYHIILPDAEILPKREGEDFQRVRLRDGSESTYNEDFVEVLPLPKKTE